MNNLQKGTCLWVSWFAGMFITLALISLDILWLTITSGSITIVLLIICGWFMSTHDANVSEGKGDKK